MRPFPATLAPLLILALQTACTAGSDNHATPAPSDRTSGVTPDPDATRPEQTAAPSPSAPDPCGLITGADIAAELGPGVGTGVPDMVGVFQSCTYQTPNNAARYYDVTVQSRAVDRDAFEQSVQAERLTTGVAPEKLDGPGKSAYDTGGILSFWSDDVQVTVLVTTPEGVDAMAAAQALGAKAVPRLGH